MKNFLSTLWFKILASGLLTSGIVGLIALTFAGAISWLTLAVAFAVGGVYAAVIHFHLKNRENQPTE